MMIKVKRLFVALMVGLTLTACSTVKPYQKAYLNDEDMKLSIAKFEAAEINAQVYREGAAGGPTPCGNPDHDRIGGELTRGDGGEPGMGGAVSAEAAPWAPRCVPERHESCETRMRRRVAK